jgi:hypothetical protein
MENKSHIPLFLRCNSECFLFFDFKSSNCARINFESNANLFCYRHKPDEKTANQIKLKQFYARSIDFSCEDKCSS